MPEHEIYAEVFAGSAKLLFAKDPCGLEVLNDLNGDLINFFRVAKHRPAELAELLEIECIHAGRFRELRTQAQPVTEIERALRFAYLVWYSFGAKGEHFASSSARSPKAKRPLDRVRELLRATADRLAKVLASFALPAVPQTSALSSVGLRIPDRPGAGGAAGLRRDPDSV